MRGVELTLTLRNSDRFSVYYIISRRRRFGCDRQVLVDMPRFASALHCIAFFFFSLLFCFISWFFFCVLWHLLSPWWRFFFFLAKMLEEMPTLRRSQKGVEDSFLPILMYPIGKHYTRCILYFCCMISGPNSRIQHQVSFFFLFVFCS